MTFHVVFLTDQVDRRAFSDVHKAATPALRRRQFGLMQSASGPTGGSATRGRDPTISPGTVIVALLRADAPRH